MGYSPQGRKESDTTEQLNFHFHIQSSLLILLSGYVFPNRSLLLNPTQSVEPSSSPISPVEPL